MRKSTGKIGRPRTQHTEQAERELIRTIKAGYYASGEKFLSTREIARRYNISLQTAHHISQNLIEQGLITRKQGSGSYISGEKTGYTSVELILHAISRKRGNFGNALHAELSRAFKDLQIPFKVIWCDHFKGLNERHFPVIWDCPSAIEETVRDGHQGLLLFNPTQSENDSMIHRQVDTFDEDDFIGGQIAAEIFKERFPGKTTAIFANGSVKSDYRIKQRIAGFHTVFPSAPVVQSDQRTLEAAREMTGKLYPIKPQCVFCTSDLFAEGLMDRYGQDGKARPALIGYGNTETSRKLNLTTLAIPLAECCLIAAYIVKLHLAGITLAATRRIFTPRPVIRRF